LKNTIVVPLPTIGEHIRRRGFDHTDKLVRALCWRCGGEYGRILRRRNNAVQVGADVEMRKKQAEGAYEAVLRADKDAEYVLVDDVWTTGSSMLAACKTMQEAGASKISVVLIAKSG